MEHKENPMQPEPEISEEEMDQLLEQFLAEEDSELPVDNLMAEEAPELSVDNLMVEEARELPVDNLMVEKAPELPVDNLMAEEAPELPVDNLMAEEAPELPVDGPMTEALPQQEPVAAEAAPIADAETEIEPAAETEAEPEEASELEPEIEAEAPPVAEVLPQVEPAPLTQDDLWENQPVDMPDLGEEIGPDLLVEAAAGLTNPADLEFEQIMKETLHEVAEEDNQPDTTEEAPEDDFTLPDEYFLPSEGGSMEELPPEKEPVYTELDMTAEQQKALEISQDEQDSLEEEEEEEAEDEEEVLAPPQKRRPKKTGTYGFFGIPHMLVTAIWLALILFIGAGIGTMIWEVAADMLAFGRPNQTVTITITSNDDLDSIAQKLHDTGLIKYPGIFKFYGNLANAEKKVKPGTYELNTVYDYMALVKNMAGTADRVSTKVVIPEGYTCAQIFRLLEKSGVCTVESMEEAVMNADLSQYWFLEGIDQSDPNCLEGYLFPDTYQFYLDHDPNSVLTRLLDTFDSRFSDTMIEKLDALNENLADMMRSHGLSESYIQDNLFTMRELVIVASMIEKETSGDEESYYIASVIYNRLTNPGEYPYLNIDAALVYITGRSPITAEDLKLDTPYNTYLYKGLIPGPISNPGLASLNAALSPENTEYYYYALDPAAGSHKFFKTYKAHQDFLESLRNGD